MTISAHQNGVTTFHNLPPASLCHGLQYLVTDLGATGTTVQSNGDVWLPVTQTGQPVTTSQLPPPSADNAGMVVFVSDFIAGGAWVRSDGVAWAQGGGSSAGGSSGSVVVLGATASTNVSAIQSALNAGGRVELSGSGVFPINAPLLIYSDTYLRIPAGMTLLKSAGTNLPMLICSQIPVTGIAVTVTWVSGLDGLVAWSSHGKVVGDYVWLTGAVESQFRGVFLITSVTDANNIVVQLWRIPTASPTGTILAKSPNRNITIACHGKFDSNQANNGGGVGPEKHTIRIAGVNINIETITVNNSLKYAIDSGATLACTFNNIKSEVTNSDVLKVYGPTNGLVVKGIIVGQCGDDVCSIQPKEPVAFAAYDWTNGDCLNVRVSDIDAGITTTSAAVCYPTLAEYCDNIIYENVKVRKAVAAPPIRIDSSAVGSLLGSFYVRGLNVSNAVSSVFKISNVTAKTIIIDGLSLLECNSSSVCEIGGSAVVEEFSLINSKVGPALQSNLININSSGGTINTVSVQNCYCASTTQTGRAITLTAGTVKQVVITNSRFVSLDGVVNYTAGAATNGTIIFSRNYCNAITNLLNIQQSSILKVFDNLINVNAVSPMIRANGAAITITVYAGSNTIESGLFLAKIVGTETINLKAWDAVVDVTTIARFDGGFCYNSNAAAGTLGVAGLVACQGTAAGSWHLITSPTLSY